MLTLQFATGGDLGARAIEWFGHGAKFSHVDVVLPNGRLFGARSDHVGGQLPGVYDRAPDYLNDVPTFRVVLLVGADRAIAFYNFLDLQRGKPYDMTGILGFIVGRNWQNSDSWFCSELITAALVACQFLPFPLCVPCNKITPPDLLLLLSAVSKVELPQ